MPPADLLNLPAYTVTHLEETTHDYHVYAAVNVTSRCCNTCHSPDVVGHGRNEQLIRDLPAHGKRVGIYVDVQRYRCCGCGKTFGQPLPHVNEKRAMTARLVEWVGAQSLRRTFASLAERTTRKGGARLAWGKANNCRRRAPPVHHSVSNRSSGTEGEST